ncbi:MAG: hypothetical protein ABI402_11630 [Ferruginibacter sp.]
MKTIIYFTLVIIMFGCGQSNKEHDIHFTTHSDPITTAFNTPPAAGKRDTTNQYIYDFMKIVIVEEKLDLSYGLSTVPEQRCDPGQEDKDYLSRLLIKKKEKSKPININEWQTIKLSVEPERCLTNTDRNSMLLQKEKLDSFEWDISRLGFKSMNNKNWYSFSVPIFSADKRKAIMMIENLCPGLCGTGNTIVFTKENNKWTSKQYGTWWH